MFHRHCADASIGTVKMLACAPCTWKIRQVPIKRSYYNSTFLQKENPKESLLNSPDSP